MFTIIHLNRSLRSLVVALWAALVCLLVFVPVAGQAGTGGGHIVVTIGYGEGADLWRVDVQAMQGTESSRQQLTTAPGADSGARWSPDGSQIVFTSMRNGSPDVFVMQGDGANQRSLTEYTGVDRDPAWSPDGTRIVFASNRSASPDFPWRLDLFVMMADGSDVQQITRTPFSESLPVWLPDGDHIAYLFDDHTAGTEAGVFVLDLTTGATERLTSPDLSITGFAWSPEGTHMAFTGMGSTLGIRPGLYVATTDGQQLSLVLPIGEAAVGPGVVTAMAFSPDGALLAVSGHRGDTSGLWIIGTDGAELHEVLTADIGVFAPDWR